MRQLLAALGSDIKPAGKNKWVARCPVHNDKDFAMSVCEKPNGGILAHCFACGANGFDLYKVLELDFEELTGRAKDNSMPHHIEETYKEDKWVRKIYESDSAAGKPISWQDKKRYKLAVARMAGVERKFDM